MKKIIMVLAVCLVTSQLIAQKNTDHLPPPPPPAPAIEMIAPPPPPPPPMAPGNIDEAKVLIKKSIAPPPPPAPPKVPKTPKAPKAITKFSQPV